MDERVDCIISSTAVPFAFPAMDIDDMLLVDGSLFSTLSIGDPIERCREEGASDEDIIVDIILCYTSYMEVPEWEMEETRWNTAFDIYKRRKAISHYYYYVEDLTRMFRGYHDVDFRLIVMPSEDLT